MPALLCALLAAPPSWSQSLKVPNAAPGSGAPRLGATAPAPAATSPAPSSTATSTSAQRVRPIDAIVAVVNNEVITGQELEARMQTVEARLKSQGVTVPPRAAVPAASCSNG